MSKSEVSAEDILHEVSDFLKMVHNKSAFIHVAIDPGKFGAIGLLCGSCYTVVDIPFTVSKVKKSRKNNAKQQAKTGHKTRTVLSEERRADYTGICALFRLLKPYKQRILVTLEQVPTNVRPPIKYSDIMLNRFYAMWPLFLFSKSYRLVEYRPNDWKQRMGLAGKDKEASRQKALTMFPGARRHLERVKDHDRAEALLLAEFSRRMHEGKA